MVKNGVDFSIDFEYNRKVKKVKNFCYSFGRGDEYGNSKNFKQRSDYDPRVGTK